MAHEPVLQLADAQVLRVADRYDKNAKRRYWYEEPMADFGVETTHFLFHAKFDPVQNGFTLCDAVRLLAGDRHRQNGSFWRC